MSGIVGSKLNIRGSGLVGSLGTDGQHLLSAGAGVTNVFETVAAAGGKIGQVVQSSIVTTEQTTTSATFVDCTGLTLDITPAATSSKIWVICNVPMKSATGSYFSAFTMIRESTNIGLTSDVGMGKVFSGGYQVDILAANILDSPSTTSEITYKLQFLRQAGGGTSTWVSFQDAPSYITAFEVLA